jgi:hypothetical protein
VIRSLASAVAALVASVIDELVTNPLDLDDQDEVVGG